MQCPKCGSWNTEKGVLGWWKCKDCGNTFYPISSATTTVDNSIVLSTVVGRVQFFLDNAIFVYNDRRYYPKVEEISGKKVIVLEEEKDETHDSE